MSPHPAGESSPVARITPKPGVSATIAAKSVVREIRQAPSVDNGMAETRWASQHNVKSVAEGRLWAPSQGCQECPEPNSSASW